MGTLGCSGSRVLWQGTKDNTQTTDGLCCLSCSHVASTDSGLQNPLRHWDTEKPRTQSGGYVSHMWSSLLMLQMINKQHKSVFLYQSFHFNYYIAIHFSFYVYLLANIPVIIFGGGCYILFNGGCIICIIKIERYSKSHGVHISSHKKN